MVHQDDGFESDPERDAVPVISGDPDEEAKEILAELIQFAEQEMTPRPGRKWQSGHAAFSFPPCHTHQALDCL